MAAQDEDARTRLVRTQLELADALRDADFGELDLIAIDMPREASVLQLRHARLADISIQGFSKVHVTEHVRAEVRDHAAVFASQFAEIRARGDARVIAIDFATVEASDRAYVEAHDDALLNLFGNAQGYVRNHVRATAHDHARLEAHNSATIAGHDQAHVSAYDATTITATPPGGSIVVHGQRIRQLDKSGHLVPLRQVDEPDHTAEAVSL